MGSNSAGRRLVCLQPHSHNQARVFTDPIPRDDSHAGSPPYLPLECDRLNATRPMGQGTINEVTWSPYGEKFAVASSLGIYIYDAETLKVLRFIDTEAWISSVAFSPEGHTLVPGGEDSAVRLWDANAGQLLRTLEEHTGWVRSVAFSPDGRTLASGSYDKTVRLWDVGTGQLLHTLEGHTHGVLRGL